MEERKNSKECERGKRAARETEIRGRKRSRKGVRTEIRRMENGKTEEEGWHIGKRERVGAAFDISLLLGKRV